VKDWKYILYVTSAVAIFFLVKALSPRQYDWRITLAHDDKNPYGAYALFTLLPGQMNGSALKLGEQTLYELRDSLRSDNLIMLATSFAPGKEDVKVMLNHIAQGGSALISAQQFSGSFADTLGFDVRDDLFVSVREAGANDTAYVQFVAHALDTAARFSFRRGNVYNYFAQFDSLKTTVIAKNDLGYPITIRVVWGAGQLILNCSPLAFTNIYLLHENKADFAAATLSYLPARDSWWVEYYHLGRRVSSSPLRFILSQEALRWAYFVAVTALILFMVFEAKRKQRIIPVMKPALNTTLSFVTTIGNLYYKSGNHKNMAEKRIAFLFEYIRTHYNLKAPSADQRFVSVLAAKSGKPIDVVEHLFSLIQFIQSSTIISAEQLIDLDRRLENFYRDHKKADVKA